MIKHLVLLQALHQTEVTNTLAPYKLFTKPNVISKSLIPQSNTTTHWSNTNQARVSYTQSTPIGEGSHTFQTPLNLTRFLHKDHKYKKEHSKWIQYKIVDLYCTCHFASKQLDLATKVFSTFESPHLFQTFYQSPRVRLSKSLSNSEFSFGHSMFSKEF